MCAGPGVTGLPLDWPPEAGRPLWWHAPGAGPCGRLGATYLAFLASFFPFAGGGIPPAAEGAVLSEAATAESPARAPHSRACSFRERMDAGARPIRAGPGRDQWLPGRGSSGTARRARGVVLAPAACRASTRLAARGCECKGAWRGAPRLRHMMCSPGPQQLQPRGERAGRRQHWGMTRRAQASGAGVDSALGARGCARRNTAAWAPFLSRRNSARWLGHLLARHRG